jgi:hypothetical protein
MSIDQSGSSDMEPLVLGDVDEVVVHDRGEGEGFAVRFPFDRRLARVFLAGVKDAQFDNANTEYQVPAEQAQALGKTVAALRAEVRLTNSEREKINALAMESGYRIQPDSGARGQVVPNVSAFIEPNLHYRGPIVNANSRFVAQHTGIGKQDGAAFIKIHKLSSLDNQNLMKGDKVGILYDDKFAAKVTDLSQYKSKEDLSDPDGSRLQDRNCVRYESSVGLTHSQSRKRFLQPGRPRLGGVQTVRTVCIDRRRRYAQRIYSGCQRH